MKELTEALDRIIAILEEMLKEINNFKETESTADTQSPNAEVVTTENITVEEIRAVMASKSKNGKTQQVKTLIQKYGAEKLSEVQPEFYADLLKEAKEL